MKAIFQNEEIGDPAYDGLTFGGYALTTPLVKADYPGLRAIRLEDGTVILAEDLPDSYTIPPGGGGSGGPHTHDWSDVTGEPSTFPPTSHDSDHDDRFSLLAHTHAAHADSDHDDRFALIEHDSAHADAFSPLAHTHAAHADSDHDDRFSLLAHAHAGVYAPVEHDTTHDDRFSLLAHTHAAHADSDHDDRFALIAQGVPAGGATGEVLAKSSATNYATVWQAASAPAPQPLDWLTDVATAGQAATNVLSYNGSSWVPAPVPGVLGYAQTTASQATITTLVDLTGLSVTVTVAASRRIKVTLWCLGTNCSVATDRGQAHIREGSTTLARSVYQFSTATISDGHTVIWIGTPSAGSHTYKGSYERLSGTGNHTWVAAADGPSFILVEDIGPA